MCVCVWVSISNQLWDSVTPALFNHVHAHKEPDEVAPWSSQTNDLKFDDCRFLARHLALISRIGKGLVVRIM